MNNNDNLRTAIQTIKYSFYVAIIIVLIFTIRYFLSGKIIPEQIDISSYRYPINKVLLDSFLLFQSKKQKQKTFYLLNEFTKSFEVCKMNGIQPKAIELNTFLQCLNNAEFETIEFYLRKKQFYDPFPVGDIYQFYPEKISGIPDIGIEILINKYRNHLTRIDYIFSTTDANALSILESKIKKHIQKK